MKKILAIDGGGIKGVFPASVLAQVETHVGQKVADFFDLIVGTSTGGIIALGLGMGFSAQEMLTFYQQLGPAVFRGSGILRFLRRLHSAKYDSEPLRAALEAKFGSRKLGESAKRLVIPSVSLITGEVHVYKTAHHPRLTRDYREPVVGVALATSAAPTYFPTYRSASGLPLIDGGLWANNPVGIAAVEGISMLGWRMGDFKMLSIGCTEEPLDVRQVPGKSWGLSRWAPRIIEVMQRAQSSSSLGIAQHLAGHENVVRISPTVPRQRYGLDVAAQISELEGFGDEEARRRMPALSDFFKEEAPLFEPYRQP
jgi:patatin-like phospholipase/acyl hydrolase